MHMFQDVKNHDPVRKVRWKLQVHDVCMHDVLRFVVALNKIVKFNVIDTWNIIQQALHLLLRSEVNETKWNARLLGR